MERKYFTVERAEKLIPRVEKSIARLRLIKSAIDSICSVKADPNVLDEDDFRQTRIKLQKEFHKLSYEFYKEYQRLESIGCVLKDVDEGLVDFYCRRSSKDVFLCWKFGEKKIKAWHSTSKGNRGRKPIVDF